MIHGKNITKVYRLYDRKKDRLLDALGLLRTKKYQEHYALRDVSFDIAKGETVGIIGVNGAGKSTLLKIITGVLSQTTGELEIGGRISALLELGAGFNMEYTGIENIYLNGTMMGYSREEVDEKLDAILRFADIGEFANQPVKKYSSGMFVRLAFALAINIDPEILVVDEALSVGDVFFQAKCFQKFEEFKEEGKTILFVSHDLSSISRYCGRVILLHRGEKLAEGSPKEMIDLYKKILTGSEEDKAEVLADVSGASKEDETAESTHPEKTTGRVQEAPQSIADTSAGGTWKQHFHINPDLSEYGDRRAEITDFAIIDDQDRLTETLIKGQPFTIRYRVRFCDTVQEPIFTFTFKTSRGTDVTGTNTRIEKQIIPEARAGEVYEVSFRQKMTMQGGDYLLSISCTGFENGELKAHHRLYDLLGITVISDKNTVGFYDMESEITVEQVHAEA